MRIITRVALYTIGMLLLVSPLMVIAQTTQGEAPATGVTVVINDTLHSPIAGVQVTAVGPTNFATPTDQNGSAFLPLAPGLYTITVAKSGFQSVSRQDVLVEAGKKTNISAVLEPTSFSSLKTIATVVSSSRSTINTSSLPLSVLPASAFTDQGQVQVNAVLNQIPGVVAAVPVFVPNVGENTALPGTGAYASVRGALAYETGTLIDGHPVSLATSGAFNISFLSPYLLQSVEVSKGPNATTPEINNDIGGTINYRTLDPTLKPAYSVDFGIDNYGGQFSNYRATGSVYGGRLGYALDYTLDGTPGPLTGRQIGGQSDLLNPSATINGQMVNDPNFLGVFVPGNPQFLDSGNFQSPLAYCCRTMDSRYFLRGELAKLRYQFSQATSFTVTYLGGQSYTNGNGVSAFQDPTEFFVPPAGYTGPATPPGITPMLDASIWNAPTTHDNGIFEAEFRSAITPNDTVLVRYYNAAVDSTLAVNNAAGGNVSFQAQLYGGVMLGTPPVETIFNGQTATIAVSGENVYQQENDYLRGLSFELYHTAGNDTFGVSYDRSHSDAYAVEFAGGSLFSGTLFPSDSGQSFQTIRAWGQLNFGPKFYAVVSDYLVNYDNHFYPNIGMPPVDSTATFNGPRISMAFHMDPNTSLRATAGSSFAPPYLSLITNPTTLPLPDNFVTPHYFTQTANSANVQPETAFGYDIGADHRFASGIVVSGDLYRTNLFGQFLQDTRLNGTYTVPAGQAGAGGTFPLFTQSTENLGNSLYEGAELSIQKSVPQGFGFTLQGALTRAYPYNVNPSIYNTAAGPNTANLAVIPYVNFQPNGVGYSGVGGIREPYSQAYGEINYRTRSGALFSLGAQYYGSNNPYNEPAFGVVNATARVPIIDRNTTLQLSVYNLTGAYDYSFPYIFNGIPVGLVNGLSGYAAAFPIGPATFRLVLHHNI